jgi:hypothetical protein
MVSSTSHKTRVAGIASLIVFGGVMGGRGMSSIFTTGYSVFKSCPLDRRRIEFLPKRNYSGDTDTGSTPVWAIVEVTQT